MAFTITSARSHFTPHAPSASVSFAGYGREFIVIVFVSVACRTCRVGSDIDTKHGTVADQVVCFVGPRYLSSAINSGGSSRNTIISASAMDQVPA
jgi:hypothetical protein